MCSGAQTLCAPAPSWRRARHLQKDLGGTQMDPWPAQPGPSSGVCSMTTPSLTTPPSGPSMASGWACSRETPSPPTPIKSVTHAGVMRETVSHLLTAVGIPLVCTETDAGDRERVLARFLERQLAVKSRFSLQTRRPLCKSSRNPSPRLPRAPRAPGGSKGSPGPPAGPPAGAEPCRPASSGCVDTCGERGGAPTVSALLHGELGCVGAGGRLTAEG